MASKHSEPTSKPHGVVMWYSYIYPYTNDFYEYMSFMENIYNTRMLSGKYTASGENNC